MNMRLNMPYCSILQIYPDQIIFIIVFLQYMGLWATGFYALIQ